MALNVPPHLRACIDQEAAEYFGHVDGLLEAAALLESTEPADRVALLCTAITHGLTGTTEVRLAKAVALAAAALERLSQRGSR
jgi:hypothetical protein